MPLGSDTATLPSGARSTSMGNDLRYNSFPEAMSPYEPSFSAVAAPGEPVDNPFFKEKPVFDDISSVTEQVIALQNQRELAHLKCGTDFLYLEWVPFTYSLRGSSPCAPSTTLPFPGICPN